MCVNKRQSAKNTLNIADVQIGKLKNAIVKTSDEEEKRQLEKEIVKWNKTKKEARKWLHKRAAY